MKREVEAGWSVADVGVGGWVNSKQEVVDKLQQVHVWRWAEHLLDDFDEWQTDFLRDGSQMLVPVLLKTIMMKVSNILWRARWCHDSGLMTVPVTPDRWAGSGALFQLWGTDGCWRLDEGGAPWWGSLKQWAVFPKPHTDRKKHKQRINEEADTLTGCALGGARSTLLLSKVKHGWIECKTNRTHYFCLFYQCLFFNAIKAARIQISSGNTLARLFNCYLARLHINNLFPPNK